MSESDERLRLDYATAVSVHGQLADIRFKLLAFVPTLTGAAVALIVKAHVDGWARAGFAALGLLATLGVLVYELRNTQFYDGAASRAQHLEQLLQAPSFEKDTVPGLFGSRDCHRRQRLWGLTVRHDLGLALVYAPALGAWAFAAAYRPDAERPWLPLALGGAVAAATFAQLRWRAWRKALACRVASRTTSRTRT